MRKGILLCCHGTRSNGGIIDTNKLLRVFKQKNKNCLVKIGYLEINKPTIEEQLNFFFKKKLQKLLVIPCMIFHGNHVTKDIPKIINKVKKNHLNKITFSITEPLISSNLFFDLINESLKKKINFLNKEKNACLMISASNTINVKAKKEIDLLANKLAKKNKINFCEKTLISLNKKELLKKILKASQRYEKIIVLPIFLFRGRLLFNLTNAVKRINDKTKKKKFILCSLKGDYKAIYMRLFDSALNT